MFPERFSREVVESMKEDLGPFGSAGQLQQRPSPLSGGIIKPAHWKVWDETKAMPKIIHAFASWDTAYTERDLESSAYSACTVWGVFIDHDDVSSEFPDGKHKIMLLSAWWGRVDYDAQLAKAREIEDAKLTKPYDAHLIEAKASGQSMIQSLRRKTKVRVLGYDPRKDGGGDKIARAYLAQPAFSAGLVWRPNRPWAERVMRLVADFPAGEALSKDIVDTTTQAVNYLVKGYWIRHPNDDINYQAPPVARKAAEAFDYILEEEDDVPRAGAFYG
jgi:predicted phage terminase large subunit-like protein